MGGNVLKNTVTRRYKRDEYFTLFNNVKDVLYEATLNYDAWLDGFVLIPSYKSKESFGDMDILINEKWFKQDMRIINIYHPTEVFCEKNSNVISFDYHEFQIDFIFIPDEYFKTALTYFSYNDLGNLMGRIANNMGVRYGHDGLKMLYYSDNKNKVLVEIHLSYDIPKIFKFLGFNYDRFLEGFNDITDIFNYVIDSEFFSKEIFAYENLNHENRTRNKKRKTYGKFLEYIQELKSDDYVYPNDKTEWLSRIDEFFPNVKVYEKIEEAKKREEVNKKIKEKFNGDIVRLITGLEGEELGKFIKKFKEFCNDFEQYILDTDVKIINENIYDYWECNYD